MATILAKEIVKSASILLRDQNYARWTAAELLRWLNDSQREVGILKPDAIAQVVNAQMVIGSKQSLPGNALRLVDCIRNTGADGGSPGLPCTLVDRDELDQQAPDWHTATPGNNVLHVVYDGRYPRTYYIYPPQAGNGRYIELAVHVTPADCTIAGVNGQSADSVISVDDIYQTAMLEYVLSRSYMKDGDMRDLNKAQMHDQNFLRRLGLKVAADAAHDPNRNAPPAQQTRQAGGSAQRARPY